MMHPIGWMKPRLQDGAERTVQSKPLGFMALGPGSREVLELGSSPSILFLVVFALMCLLSRLRLYSRIRSGGLFIVLLFFS